MKTVIEVWNSRNPCHDFNDNGVDRFYLTMEMCMKEYAQQVAEQVRQDCAKNVRISGEWITNDLGKEIEVFGTVDKQSILSTEIKLP